MRKFIFIILVCFCTTSANAMTSTFEENLLHWLSEIGFLGKLNSVSKEYDEDGFLDNFSIDLQEYAPHSRTHPNIVGIVTKNKSFQEIQLKVLDKDLKGIPYMYFDWTARLVIKYALKKIAKLLGFQISFKKVGNGLTQVTLDPAKASEDTRYRFRQIQMVYSVNNLVLDAYATLWGNEDYLITEYLKGELNALLRSLERGKEAADVIIFDKTFLRSSGLSLSDRLLKEVLKEPSSDVLEEIQLNHGLSL